MFLRRLSTLAVVTTLLLAGCGDDDETTATAGSDSTEMGEMDEMSETTAMGATAGKADRVIEVKMLAEQLRFDPATIAVKAGETVTFKITNEADTFHDFMLGTEKEHEARDMEMLDMSDKPMDMDDEANSVTLEGGETKELNWTFEEAETVIFGCHQPGHYGAGMKGTVTVS